VRTDDGQVEQSFSFGEVDGSFFGFQRYWSPDGRHLIIPARVGGTPTAPQFRTVRIDTATGALHPLADAHRYAAWYPDASRYILATGSDGFGVHDAATDRLLWSLSPSHPLPAAEFSGGVVRIEIPSLSPDGQLLAVNVVGRDAASGEEMVRLAVLDAGTGRLNFWVEGADCGSHWTADGAWLLVGGFSMPGVVSYLVAGDGSAVRPFPHGPLASLSPLDGGTGIRGADDGQGAALIVFDVPDGSERHRVSVPGARFAIERWLDDGRVALLTAHPVQRDCFPRPSPGPVSVRFP